MKVNVFLCMMLREINLRYFVLYNMKKTVFSSLLVEMKTKTKMKRLLLVFCFLENNMFEPAIQNTTIYITSKQTSTLSRI